MAAPILARQARRIPWHCGGMLLFGGPWAVIRRLTSTPKKVMLRAMILARKAVTLLKTTHEPGSGLC